MLRHDGKAVKQSLTDLTVKWYQLFNGLWNFVEKTIFSYVYVNDIARIAEVLFLNFHCFFSLVCLYDNLLA